MSKLKKNSTSSNLSNGLTERLTESLTESLTDAVIVSSNSSYRGSSSNNHKSIKDSQDGRGYKIIMDPEDARLFIKEVKKLQNLKKEKKRIKINNSINYKNVVEHINEALKILSNDISQETIKLKKLKKEFEDISNNDMFYVFDKSIKCKVIIDNAYQDGEIIGIDDGVLAVAKTDKGIFTVTMDNQININNGNNSSESESTSEKSIFTSSNKVESGKLSSQPTESLSSSSIQKSSVTSPYLATSEYSSSAKYTSNMKGGKIHNSGMKFMKAGKADNIGILEASNNNYGESTSIEEGLCE